MTFNEQLSLSNDKFKHQVKCCYNCTHWQRDPFLMGDYAFNVCRENTSGMSANIRWDCCCGNYSGEVTEENLLFRNGKLTPEYAAYIHTAEKRGNDTCL